MSPPGQGLFVPGKRGPAAHCFKPIHPFDFEHALSLSLHLSLLPCLCACVLPVCCMWDSTECGQAVRQQGALAEPLFCSYLALSVAGCGMRRNLLLEHLVGKMCVRKHWVFTQQRERVLCPVASYNSVGMNANQGMGGWHRESLWEWKSGRGCHTGQGLGAVGTRPRGQARSSRAISNVW